MKKIYFLIVLAVFFNSCQDYIIEKESGKIDGPLLSSRSSHPLDDKPAVDFYHIYDFEKSTLNQQQRENLFELSRVILSKYPCLINLLKELHYNHGVKIKFEIKSRMDGMGCFDINSKTISFRSESYMQEEQVVLEELLHVLQYYLCGSSHMYAKKNAEYEIKVIRDVICRSSGSYYGMTGKEEIGYIKGYGMLISCMQTGRYSPKKEEFNQWARDWQDELTARYSDDFEPCLLWMCIGELKK